MNTKEARAFLDVLAMNGNAIERWHAIKALCEAWNVPLVMHEYGHAPIEMATIKALAHYVLEGYEESDNPLNESFADELESVFTCSNCGAKKVHFRLRGYVCPSCEKRG